MTGPSLTAFDIGLFPPQTAQTAQSDVADPTKPVPTERGIAQALEAARAEMNRALSGSVVLPDLSRLVQYFAAEAVFNGAALQETALLFGPEHVEKQPNWSLWVRAAGHNLSLQLIPNPFGGAPSAYTETQRSSESRNVSFLQATTTDYGLLPETGSVTIQVRGTVVASWHKSALPQFVGEIVSGLRIPDFAVTYHTPQGVFSVPTGMTFSFWWSFVVFQPLPVPMVTAVDILDYRVLYEYVTITTRTLPNPLPPPYQTAWYPPTEIQPGRTRLTGVLLSDGSPYFGPPRTTEEAALYASVVGQPAPHGLVYPASSGGLTPMAFPGPAEVDSLLARLYSARVAGSLLDADSAQVLDRALTLGWVPPAAARSVALSGRIRNINRVRVRYWLKLNITAHDAAGRVLGGQEPGQDVTIEPGQLSSLLTLSAPIAVPRDGKIRAQAVLGVLEPVLRADIARSQMHIWDEATQTVSLEPLPAVGAVRLVSLTPTFSPA